jgi:hypothetical protein
MAPPIMPIIFIMPCISILHDFIMSLQMVIISDIIFSGFMLNISQNEGITDFMKATFSSSVSLLNLSFNSSIDVMVFLLSFGVPRIPVRIILHGQSATGLANFLFSRPDENFQDLTGGLSVHCGFTCPDGISAPDYPAAPNGPQIVLSNEGPHPDPYPI